METIRDMEPPPHIVGIQHFVDYKSVDEILKSKDFRQGSHQESQPFFGRSLLTIDHGEHFDRSVLVAGVKHELVVDGEAASGRAEPEPCA